MTDRLYDLAADADPARDGASVLVNALGGFVDAGAAQRLLTQHLLDGHESRVLATFDVDQLLDYRGRRPVMTFDRDRWTHYEGPALHLHRVVDRAGTPFLLLAGPEPDYQWERMVAAVSGLAEDLGVQLTVSVHGIPMSVPHTRPLGATPHATDARLIGETEPLFGKVQVPASFTALLEYRLGETGKDAVGYAVHVPHYLAQAEYPDAALVGLDALVSATGLDLSRDELAEAAVQTRSQIAREVEGNAEIATLVSTLEEQWDALTAGRQRPSLLGPEELPSADEIGADVEAFLRDIRSDDPGPDATDASR